MNNITYQVKARDSVGNHHIKGSYSDKAEAYRKADELTAQQIYESVYLVPIDRHTGRLVLEG